MQLKILVNFFVVIGGALLVLYVWFGIAAFRKELNDFKSTPDNENAATSAAFQRMDRIAQPVHWALKDGSKQRAFFVPTQNGVSIVYAHGSPGNGRGFLELLSQMTARGYGALALDLPGYGESEGKRDWGSTYTESMLAGVDFLLAKDARAENIGAFGYSMGGVVAARSISKDRRIGGLILQSAYTNLTEQLHYSFQRKVPAMGYFAIAAAYWSGVAVGDMDVENSLVLDGRPLLVIGGDQDRVTPAFMQQRISDRHASARLWLVEGAGHTNLPATAGKAYYDRLDVFWQQLWPSSQN